MDDLLKIFGNRRIYRGFMEDSYGSFMDYLYRIYGGSMEDLWKIYGNFMDDLWMMNG